MKGSFQAGGRARAGARSSVAMLCVLVLSILALGRSAWAQMVNSADTVRRGHDLAAVARATCHRVAVDQRSAPILAPPAPSFDAIAQRADSSADALGNFIVSTRRTPEHPTAMPNPHLSQYQVDQVVAYILSLRK